MEGEFLRHEVVQHLHMIQGIVNRLSRMGVVVKAASVNLLAAGLIWFAVVDVSLWMAALAFALAFAGLWALDGFYLWQERLYRNVYNNARRQPETDFGMNPFQAPAPPSLLSAVFSWTLAPFYLGEVACFAFLGKLVAGGGA